MKRRQDDSATETVQTTFRIPKDTMWKFREVAAAEHRSAAAEMRRLMEQRIAEHDDDHDKAAA